LKRNFYLKSKVILSLFLTVLLLASVTTSAFAIKIPEGNEFIKDTPFAGSYIESETAAKLLSRIELLKSTNGDFDLEKAPTMVEGLIMYIKLLGKDKEAVVTPGEPCKFSDISYMEKAYVNYTFRNKLLDGIGQDSFNPSQSLDENMFFIFLLTALGYDHRTGDFSLDNARSKAFEIGILSDSLYNNFAADGFQKDSMAQVCYFALMTEMKGTEKTLAEELVSKGAIKRIAASEIGILPAANIFCEDFEVGNLEGWKFYGGSWSRETWQFKTTSETPSKTILEGSDFSDFIYKAYIIIQYDYTNKSNPSILFRVKNPGIEEHMYDGYYAEINNLDKSIVLGKASSITREKTVIKSAPIRNYTKRAYYLKVRAHGKNIKVYLDDELYMDVNDDSYSSGSIGVKLCKPGAYFNEIIACELTEEAEASEGKISGEYNNYIKYFYHNTKKHYTSKAKNNIPFESTRGIELNDETLINFTKELTKGIDNDYEKAKVIYNWVTTNIYYDLTSPRYESNFKAKNVFEDKYAVCAGYANLLASLMNIAGIPCIVVGGATNYDKNGINYDNPHSWNEAYIDERWVIMDSTWDTYNKYEGGEFKPWQKWDTNYFDPDLEIFSQDHKIETYFNRK
jgi:hypothetical protein